MALDIAAWVVSDWGVMVFKMLWILWLKTSTYQRNNMRDLILKHVKIFCSLDV
jgi:hypothetical protein